MGANSVDVMSYILKTKPLIRGINLWLYNYIPLEQTERGDGLTWIVKKNDEDDLGDILNGFLEDSSSDKQIAISSEVELASGEHLHIPMMDFNYPKNSDSLKVIKERLQYIEASKGWILETEMSYHYFGEKLLTKKEWVDFMGRCLLTSIVHSRDNIQEVADSRYIGHSLRRGCNTLRLTTREDKTVTPIVVASI